MNNEVKPWAYLVSIYNLGNEISGGDKILVYLTKYLSENYRVKLFCAPEVIPFIANDPIVNEIIIEVIGDVFPTNTEVSIGKLASHMYARYTAFKKTIQDSCDLEQPKIIYSASDFPPDLMGGVYLKNKFQLSKFIAGYYLFAPHPFRSDSPYKGIRRLRGVVYWLMQLITIKIAKKYADYLFVTSPDEKKTALRRWKQSPNEIGVVYGGIPVDEIQRYISIHSTSTNDVKNEYDGVFVGRLHYQKGVINLVDIWELVVKMRPDSTLAIIGDGPLYDELNKKVKEKELQKNIVLLGYVDGVEKWKIYTKSRITLHPATYDSGGMAAAEGLAFGLPGLAFDLPSLKEYYSQGMLKATCFSNEDFAQKIVSLLSDNDAYQALSIEAKNYAFSEWGWKSKLDNTSKEVFGRAGMVL